MDQPVFWGSLLAVAVLAAAVRLRAGRPLLARHAAVVDRLGLLVAAACAFALVFHCAAMFFGPWVDAIPGAQAPADTVRAMGTGSRLAYWLPAVALVVSLRRIWWPGLLLLAVALSGVGITMYGPYALDTHLGWLAAVILVGVFTSAALIRFSPDPVAALESKFR